MASLLKTEETVFEVKSVSGFMTVLLHFVFVNGEHKSVFVYRKEVFIIFVLSIINSKSFDSRKPLM